MGRNIQISIVKTKEGVTIRNDIADASTFSASEQCPVLETDVHDDDILIYTLYVNGREVDTYNSCPGFFDDGDTTPVGGDATVLAAAFGKPEEQSTLEKILRFDAMADSEEEQYIFASERLYDLVETLGGDSSELDAF
jgi:hypothetical protein